MSNKHIAQIALMVAVIICLGLFPGIPVGIIPVPIVLQNMGIMLAGLLLGGRRGTVAVACFVLLAAVGLPILSGMRGGLATIVGPTGGYIIAWLATPALINALLIQFKRWHQTNYWTAALAMVVSVLFVYPVAIIWLLLTTPVAPLAAIAANGIFIPGDLIKAAITVLIAIKINRVLHTNPNLN